MIVRDSFFKELQNTVKYYHSSDITKKFKFTYWPVGNYDGKMKSLRTFTVPANDIYDAKLIFGLIVPHYAIYEITELT